MKKIVLSDRGCLFVDSILQNTNWEIVLLIVDDFGHHKEKYIDNDRIKKIITFSDLINWDGEFNLRKEDVKHYLSLFNVGDYGSRRIKDDYFYSHFQFYQGIAFWNDFFSKNDVDLCLIINTLHGFVNDYILEAICERNCVDCFNIFYHFIDKFGLYHVQEHSLVQVGQIDLKEINIEKVATYRSRFDYDVLKDIPYFRIAKVIYRMFGAKGIRYVGFLFRNKQNIHYREVNFFEYRKSLKKINQVQRYVRKTYVSELDNVKFVAYFLHFEPEAVLTGNAQIIDSQLVHIKMLSDCIPKGWILYVKEHPDLYENINSWELEYHIPALPTFYTEYFYKKLQSFKNVRLLNHKIPASKLIAKCEALSTVAGTVMTEAISKNKPVLMFADDRHVYKYSNEIFHINSMQDIQDAVHEILNGFVPDYKNIQSLCNEYLVSSDTVGKINIVNYLKNI